MSTTLLRAQHTWAPEGIILEDAALEVVRSACNHLVIAGPGAGKTELLAQRACYLLQTNSCPFPKRILSVSFKKDSASNLEDRVANRCGKDLAARLDSYTFDKFCKEILDRFRLTLPIEFQPDKDYRVDTDNKLLFQAYQLAGYPVPRINPQETKPNYPKSVVKIMAHGLASANFNPALNFNLISRLALNILQHNGLIRTALQKTYSHIFLDEFQDTTSLQYEIVTTCFSNSASIITAVGDQKQRIMLWAGAMPNAFEQYEKDFKAISKTMIMNHRSAPKLLHLQKSLYKALNEKDIDITPSTRWQPEDGQALISIFDDEMSERAYIRKEIEQQLLEGCNPRDICILVKRSIAEYLGDLLENDIIPGVKVRNEVVYQDLLKEDAVKLILAALYCAVTVDNPDAYMYLQDTDLQVKNTDIDDIDKVNAQYAVLSSFINLLASELKTISTDESLGKFPMLVDSIINYIGEKEYCDTYPQYQNGDFFSQIKQQAISLIGAEFRTTHDWLHSLKNFEGDNSIPAMTIHKSKGLEFETVFVVGIEDATFFADNHPLSAEDISAFFVSVSRAKRNLFITTSKNRNDLKNGKGKQSYCNAKVLYEALKNSGYIGINNVSE